MSVRNGVSNLLVPFISGHMIVKSRMFTVILVSPIVGLFGSMHCRIKLNRQLGEECRMYTRQLYPIRMMKL